MTEIIVTNPFGACPKCGGTSGYVNTGPGLAWFICDEHRIRWPAPPGMFLSWRRESVPQLSAHWGGIKDYEAAQPLPWNGLRPKDAPSSFDGELGLLVTLIEMLLSSDSELQDWHARAYRAAAAQAVEKPEMIAVADAFALFMAAIIKARELAGLPRRPVEDVIPDA